MTNFKLHHSTTVSDVWCPETSNGIWQAVHPNGKAFITGNSAPNLAQVPSSKEFRSLFDAPKGWEFVGADLANIEIRILAHHLTPYDDGKYAQAVLKQDMHWLTSSNTHSHATQ